MTVDTTEVVPLSPALMPLAQNREQAPLGWLNLDEKDGWVKWKPYAPVQQASTRLCWLPIELRGPLFANHEGLFVVVSASTQQLTAIDFTSMLKNLFKSGFVLLRNPSASLPTDFSDHLSPLCWLF
jgi:hypothetical protein